MKKIVSIFILISLNITFLFAQRHGVIYGTIKDKSTNSVLPGANVAIMGTAIGTITDLEGKYRLMGVPAGEHEVVISFIGYDKIISKVIVRAGEDVEFNADLVITSTDLEEVVVTAQMVGQIAAINQQLNSDALVNVVSSDKMRELPDINAAEAIGRLPGISINRNGGEAQTINIRGFGADYTSVTINGIKMPETGTDTRSVNLSSISPDLLSHIEVYKSPTADMDGDAIGGIVSLGLKPAPSKNLNQITLGSGFSTLAMKPNYKGNLRVSRRLLNNRLGVILNSSFDITDRSSQDMSTNYTKIKTDSTGKDIGYEPWAADNLSLTYKDRGIQRIGVNLQSDYQFAKGNIVFQGMYNRKNTNTYNQGYNYNGIGQNIYSLSINENVVDMYQLMLSGEKYLSWLEIQGAISYNHTVNETPYSPDISFTDPYAFRNELATVTGLTDITDKLDYLNKDFSDATMARMDWSYDSAMNKNMSAALNFKTNYHITSNIAGFIKFGGKLQFDTREKIHTPLYQRYDYDQEQLFANATWLEETGDTLRVAPNKRIMISNFNVQDKETDFWNGEYSIWPYFPESILRSWYGLMNVNRRPDPDFMHLGYNVEEKLYAGYIMGKLSVGQWLSFVPGVRYEYSDNYYQGKWSSIAGTGVNLSGMVKDTSVTKQYGHFLPSAHLKITPVKWMDLRLSYAKTLKRPNYNQVVPTTRIDADAAALIDLGNGDLNEMIAKSYDASVSFYTGKFGLISFGIFTKEFTNYITDKSYVIPSTEAVKMGLPSTAWEIRNIPVNLPDLGYVKGYEVDIQTNFKYLPKPFDGFILNFNITKLSSHTKLEKWQAFYYYDRVLRRTVINFDSSYFYKEDAQLTSQIDMVFNTTLGYELKGFSFRASAQYQGLDLMNSLNTGQTEISQRYNDSWLRIDIAMAQKIGKHFKLRINAANITRQVERDYIYQPKYWRNESRYGSVYQVGVEYNF